MGNQDGIVLIDINRSPPTSLNIAEGGQSANAGNGGGNGQNNGRGTGNGNAGHTGLGDGNLNGNGGGLGNGSVNGNNNRNYRQRCRG